MVTDAEECCGQPKQMNIDAEECCGQSIQTNNKVFGVAISPAF